MFAVRIAVATAAVLGFSVSGDAHAQTASGSNYRSLAVCEEVLVDGRWFNTFGEGRCPPGSRRAPHRTRPRGDDVNALSMRRMEGQVQALAGIQQSLLETGRAIGERYQAESDERFATYAYHLVEDASDSTPFVTREFLFPTAGRVTHAKAGDPFLMASNGYYSPCFVALEDGSATQLGGHRHNVRSGELTCKLQERDRAYMPLYNNYTFSGGEMSMGQTLEQRDGLYTICYRSMGMNAMCVRRIPADKVIETTGIVELTQTSRILATFEGVTDNQLQVRLMQSDTASESETVTFDLSQSRTIEVLGATFEVLEFTDAEIVMQRTLPSH